ncbi:MAG TPA: serine/threonine-protein kinase [Candidatus Krumholzibacteria bacterium]|nr:serine/threonine-protein kinase [Candidatus Krumholzibacteria bacterium]
MAIHIAIEGYDSLEQIGVGGMAAVYKARKISIDKTVAIKVLFPYLATDPSFTDRFQREAKAAASIQHDNIVNVIDFGESDGSCYIVMEYYDGRTLEDLMKSRGGVPLDVAAQIILEVAYGLEAAHAMDIVHRDIKPANIIFTLQGGIKIADFGLAKKSDAATLITQHGKVMGTPAYMSPEQAAGGSVGPASDIFSLGVVAYELLGRRKPFDGKTYSEVLEKIQTVEPVAIAEANPLIEPEFNRVVARMLAKNVSARYASAVALIADLEAAMEESNIARDRRRLAAYVKDPAGYETRNSEQVIAQCLSRGASFMQKGTDHLDEAMLEFRRILFLDPVNDRARKNLQTIRKRRGDNNQTVAIDVPPASPGEPDAPARNVTGGEHAPRRRRPRPHRRIPRWTYGVGIAGVVALLGALLWNAGRMSDRTAGRADTTPALSSLAESPLLIDASPAGNEVDADSSRTGAREPAAKGTSAAGLAADNAKPPRHVQSETSGAGAAKPEVTRAVPSPAKVAEGTLSVFFLGGVGEVLIDGKPFAHEPPFEGVPLPAGTHRIACRMSGDDTPREIEITIAPDRATVVEYEMGGQPVVTEGP